MIFARKNIILILLVGLSLVSCDSTESGKEKSVEENSYYTEKHRPQLHFSPEANWMNDPNGMVYYEGEYHLFYQYYPDSTVWGPMHWGHAVSKNLIHWEHLPIALYPDEHGYIFSGSAVIDWNNTSGFGSEGKPAMIAIYSYHHPEKAKAGDIDFQTQGIAYSNDKGRTWTKYDGNPVITNPGIKDFRDPKVIWHEESQKWVMALAVFDHLQFYGSPDLKEWELLSEFGKEEGSHDGVWECPDLFKMKADNGKDYWVVIENMNPGNPNGGSGTQYFIGQFDGKKFTVDPAFDQLLDTTINYGSVWLDAGRDNYAGVTWSDVPEEDGRRLFMGWMSNWSYAQKVPTEKWRSAMTLPLELQLIIIDDIPRLIGYPAKEVMALRGSKIKDENKQLNFKEGLAEVNLQFASDKDLKFTLSNAVGESIAFSYKADENSFLFDRTNAGPSGFSDNFAGVHRVTRISKKENISLKTIIDHSSIEIFLDDGANFFTEIFFPTEIFTTMNIDGEVSNLECYELKQIWR